MHGTLHDPQTDTFEQFSTPAPDTSCNCSFIVTTRCTRNRQNSQNGRGSVQKKVPITVEIAKTIRAANTANCLTNLTTLQLQYVYMYDKPFWLRKAWNCCPCILSVSCLNTVAGISEGYTLQGMLIHTVIMSKIGWTFLWLENYVWIVKI